MDNPLSTATAQTLLEQALARPKDDWDGKIADYTQAIRLAPQDARLYINRGFSYEKRAWTPVCCGYNDETRDDLDRALADYTEAIQINRNDALIYLRRSDIWFAKDNDHAFFADTRQFSRKYLANTRNIHLEQSGWNYNDTDLEEGLANAYEFMRLTCQSPDPYFEQGAILYNEGDLDASLAKYSQGIRIQLYLAYNWTKGSGVIPEGKIDLDEIFTRITTEESCASIRVSLAAAYYRRGIVCRAKSNWDDALDDFGKALRLNPPSIANEVMSVRQKVRLEQEKHLPA